MIETPVPLVAPKCPDCGEPIAWGDVEDILLWDTKFNMGKGGYVRLIGWVACGGSLVGTVVDSFDAEGNSNWVKRPRPHSTEHVYLMNLDGRKIEDIHTCEIPVEVMTREEYNAKYEAFLQANPVVCGHPVVSMRQVIQGLK